MLPPFPNRHWPDSLPEKEAIRLWKRSGLKAGTIVHYRRILGIFFAYCSEGKVSPISQLTVDGAVRFYRWYTRRGRRGLNRRILRAATRSSLFAYSWALSAMGTVVPIWKVPPQPIEPAPIVTEYVAYAREFRGLAPSSLTRDTASLTEFLGYLRRRHQDWQHLTIRDIDRYLVGLTRKLAPATVGRIAYVIRSWIRFLHAKGQLRHDLAPAIVSPVRRRYDQPPRALPWPKVRRMLRAVDATTALGRRDRAQFLLMSAYGLGSAEVLNLRFNDIDWTGRQLHVVRRKTGTPIKLPLLPDVARALAHYIRHGRPKLARSPYVFLSMRKPYRPFESTGVLRHRVRDVARRAGINNSILGAHLFRHSYATRQIEIGTPMKTLADILGHRDPETTSIYTRAAVQHLRRLALPIPR